MGVIQVKKNVYMPASKASNGVQMNELKKILEGICVA